MKLILVYILLITTQIGFSAEVKKLLRKSKKIVISEGKNTGFDKNKEVCVYDENDSELVCSIIYKAKNKKSYARIKNKTIFKSIKKGYSVKLKEQSSTTTSASKSMLKIGYLLSPVTPSKYNVLTYKAPTTTGVESLWSKDRASSFAPFGANLEFGFGMLGSKAAIGIKYRSFKGYAIKTDYSSSDASQFAETTTDGTSFSAYFDYFYLSTSLGTFGLDVGSGLDFDMSSVSMTSQLKNDAGTQDTTIYDVSSSASLISLRVLSANLNIDLDPLGFTLGTSILIPVSSSTSTNADVNDSQIDQLDNNVTAINDVSNMLDHTNSSVGIELVFASYFSF